MQTQTTVRYQVSPTRMVICIFKWKLASAGENTEKLEHSYVTSGGCKMVQLPWKTVWWFFKNLNIESPHNPAIPLLGLYPKELKTGIHTDARTGTFITALFAIVKT